MTILVVDDDAGNRAMLSLTLRQAGHKVATAFHGDEALRLLERTRYDWLITDAKMSPMDGFTLSRKAKSLQPKLRILMVSAVCTDADCADSPIEKCFPKPVAPEGLLAWLNRSPAA